jgi:hypothetical protein
LDEIRASRISNKKLPLIEKQFLMRLIFRRTFEEVLNIYDALDQRQHQIDLHVIYWLGKLAIDEIVSITNVQSL